MTTTPKSKETIIEIKNIIKKFGDVTVLDDVNLSIKKGEFVTLLGPSGCGKTTLLRLIAGFDTPTTGKIFLGGKDVTLLPPHRRAVNTVFQKYALFPHLSVYGNIAFGLKLAKISDGKVPRTVKVEDGHKTNKKGEILKDKSGNPIPNYRLVTEYDQAPLSKREIKIPDGIELDSDGHPVLDSKGRSIIKYRTETEEFYPSRKLTKVEISEKVNKALTLVGLEGYGHRDTGSLSGGQQQRVAIARAIVCEPKVLLLDEPLGALDLKMRKEMQIELMNMHRNLGITFVYVTHDQEEALTMSDKIAVMRDGIIQQLGTPKQIYDEPQNAFVADFIGESNILSGTMIKDLEIEFAGTKFVCEDKGFGKNERVDIVIRPEDIYILEEDNPKGMLKGEIVSVIFKGTYYEIEISCEGYQFTAQDTQGWEVGDKVGLYVRPHDIHVMKKDKIINTFDGTIKSETHIELLGGVLELGEPTAFEQGSDVMVKIEFDKVILTDDPDDSPLSGKVTDTLYKGDYYQVQVYVADADDFVILNTSVEWDIGDRVGIQVAPQDIIIQAKEESKDI